MCFVKIYMVKLLLLLFRMFLSVIFAVVPDKTKKNKENLDGLSCINANLSGKWQILEVYSEYNKITHRYYYHPGPSPSSPVFLFLHGFAFNGRNFETIHTLSDTWQLIAYDFPESSPYYRGDMNDFRFLLDDFLDIMHIDELYLCGVSFGGGVALRYAASHVRRIKALVLVSSFIMNSTAIDRLRSREIARFLLKYPDYKISWLLKKILWITFLGKSNPMKPIQTLIKVKNADWYRQVIQSITTCEGTEDAAQIKCPVLSLQGTIDKTVAVKHARTIPQYIPHSEFQLIEKGTHAMMYLQGDMLAGKIREFCRKNMI